MLAPGRVLRLKSPVVSPRPFSPSSATWHRSSACRLGAGAVVAAFAALGALACGPSAEGFVAPPAPTSSLYVEVRDASGSGIAGVPLELRGDVNWADAATVHKRAATGSDGTVDLGPLMTPHPYRLFVAPPAGYGFAPEQVSPVYISIDGTSFSGRPPGEGYYGVPPRVVVRLVRLP
jgi:hypothetical protein